MQAPSPAEMPAAGHDFHRSTRGVDRAAVIVALIISIVAGIATTQSLDSIAVGLIIGSTLFALLAPLLAATVR